MAAEDCLTYSAYCNGCLVCMWDIIPEVDPSGLLILALHDGFILHKTTFLSSVSINFSQSRTFLLEIFFLLDLDACCSACSGTFLFLPLLPLCPLSRSSITSTSSSSSTSTGILGKGLEELGVGLFGVCDILRNKFRPLLNFSWGARKNASTRVIASQQYVLFRGFQHSHFFLTKLKKLFEIYFTA